MIMTKRFFFSCAVLLSIALGSLAPGQSSSAAPALQVKISTFELTNQTFFDGISRLSAEPISLAFEDDLKNKAGNSQGSGLRFNVKLENSSIREVLDALCSKDNRYMWTTDGSTINVYPKAVDSDPAYLLNRKLEKIELRNTIDPYQALTPISRQLPGEQIGYFHLGGDVRYAQPWTVSFENMTVRQIINRVTAHLGTRGGWTLSGSKGNRFFTFHNGEFRRAETN